VATIERILGDPKVINALLGGTQDLLADIMHAEAARLRGQTHYPTGGQWDRVHAATDDLVQALTARIEKGRAAQRTSESHE